MENILLLLVTAFCLYGVWNGIINYARFKHVGSFLYQAAAFSAGLMLLILYACLRTDGPILFMLYWAEAIFFGFGAARAMTIDSGFYRAFVRHSSWVDLFLWRVPAFASGEASFPPTMSREQALLWGLVSAVLGLVSESPLGNLRPNPILLCFSAGLLYYSMELPSRRAQGRI